MKPTPNLSAQAGWCRRCGTGRDSEGFSLVEMLVVVAVVALLIGLAAPALTSMTPMRKAALTELKGFLESAAVLAQKENRDVYVAFADASAGEEAAAFRQYAMFRAEDAELSGGDTLLTRPLVQATRWEALPEGVVFALGEDFELAAGQWQGNLRTVHDMTAAGLVRIFDVVESDAKAERKFPFLLINASSRVEVPPPPAADALHIGIVEGYYTKDEGRVVVSEGRTECLRIGQYTGRPRIISD